MITLYHAAPLPGLEGQEYRGSDREKLSEFLGGPVGYACLSPRQAAYWLELADVDAYVYELEVPDDCPLIVSLTRREIPQRDYDGASFLDVLASGGYWHGTFGELVNYADKLPKTVGEVAFLARGVKFGRRR